MFKKYLLITLFVTSVSFARSQGGAPDSISRSGIDSMALDDDIDYDELMNDLDIFLDSILGPRSYTLISLSGGQGYFNFTNKNNTRTKLLKKFTWSPTFGYYDKSGLGITLASYMVNDGSKRYWYQASVTPSYDYLDNRDFATGVAYTRYLTRNSVPFYTSPLQNEINGYLHWRGSWLQPAIMASYGWGSRTEFNRIQVVYEKMVSTAVTNRQILVSDTVNILRRNKESIVDFSVAASVHHDFYWLDIFSHNDHIRLSPMLSLSGGTQKFGFNHTTDAYGSVRALALNNTRNVTLKQKFQLLSATLYLRGEYSFGKFFVQPQLLLDYYLPAKTDNFATVFSFTTGFMF